MRLQYVTLLSLLLLHHSRGQLNCPSQQPSHGTIVSEAIHIGRIRTRDIQQAFFPDISFTCSGALNKWTIVAKPVGGGSRFPQLQIWRSTGGRSYERVAQSVVDDSVPVATTAFVYEHTPTTPLQFQAGDILGVFTPPVPRLTFKYQEQGGPLNYYIGGPATAYATVNLDQSIVLKSRNDYPLVSVNVTNPECARGFIRRDTLLVKASILSNNRSDLTYREATQRILPNIAFHCSGVILSYTVAALKRLESSTRRAIPELQVWRRVGDSTTWVKVQGAGADAAQSDTEELNVYRYTPVPPLPFQEGDILGLYQPYSSASVFKIYLQGSGVTNYYRGAVGSPLNTFRTSTIGVGSERRLPLVSVEVSHASTVAIPLTSTPSQLPTITSHTSTTAISPTSTPSQPSTIIAHSNSIAFYPTSIMVLYSTPSQLPTITSHTSTTAISPTSTPSQPSTIIAHSNSIAFHPISIMVLYSTPSHLPTITLSQLPTTFGYTSAIVLHATSTPITPTHTPTITSHSNELMVVVGVVLIVVVCVVIVVLGVGVWRWRRRRGRMQVDGSGSRMEAVNKVSAEDSMEYNPMYQPQNQQEIITDGRRQALSLHTNKAYGDPKAEPQATQQPNKKEEHIYESIN